MLLLNLIIIGLQISQTLLITDIKQIIRFQEPTTIQTTKDHNKEACIHNTRFHFKEYRFQQSQHTILSSNQIQTGGVEHSINLTLFTAGVRVYLAENEA
jgi:hypothetical protein